MAEPTTRDDPVLEISGLDVRFETPDGEVHAVRGADLRVLAGETLAIVGESGSGKSQLALAALGLIAANGRATGSVRYRGSELIGLTPRALNRYRGAKLSMIFQEPMTSLDPHYRIERQIAEPLIHHRGMSRRAARPRVLELLELVGIPDAEARLRAYPHELSGGQRQRVMIAMALANEPDLLIADEPTTALDVTIQAQILDLMKDLQRETGMAIVLITHDLGVVARMADEVAVMYAGQIVERGTVDDVFYRSSHPYTLGLRAAMPTNDPNRPHQLTPIEGSPPDLFHPPDGCGYFARCPYAMKVCEHNDPGEFTFGTAGSQGVHRARCWQHHESAPSRVPGLYYADAETAVDHE